METGAREKVIALDLTDNFFPHLKSLLVIIPLTRNVL